MPDAFEPKQSQNAENAIAEYMERAERACESGDVVGGMHLYLAAYGFAMGRSRVPNELAIVGLKRAWSIACSLHERSLAEYVFEKMVPYLTAAEEAHCAAQLQSLALDKLAEFGLTRERLAQFAGMAAGGNVVPGPMKLMHLGSFRMPSFPDDLSSIDGLDELDQLVDQAAQSVASEADGSGMGDDVRADAPVVDQVGSVVAVSAEEAVRVSEDCDGRVHTGNDLAEETVVVVDGGNDAVVTGEGVDEAEGLADGKEGAEPVAAAGMLPVFSDIATLDDLMPFLGGGAPVSVPATNPVDEYFGEQSLQDKFEAAFEGVRGKVEEGEAGLAATEAALESDATALDPSAIAAAQVFNAPGSFEITDDGISLGPGFGFRLPPEETDEEATKFDQMITSLNETMANFEKNNGQRMVAPMPDANATQASLTPRAGAIVPGELPEDATFADLVGYDRAIDVMQSFGIGLRGDPEFLSLVEALNELHGIDNMPATDSLLFRSIAREDSNQFMEATANELGLPTIRMSMDETINGSFALCLTMRADNPPQMNKTRTEFVAPAVLYLEDIDLWMAPVDFMGDDTTPWPQRLTRGAQEAVRLIRSAVENPEVYVLASMSTYGEIDGFFCDILTPFSVVEIDPPDDEERMAIWKTLMRSHPSLSNLRLQSLVEYSANMPRGDIYIAVREAIEEAYKQSLATRTYMPVTYDNLLEKLSAYQPLESEEYKNLEDEVAGRLRSELDAYDSVDSLLGLDDGNVGSDGNADGEGKTRLDLDEDFDLDNPYFAL